MHPDKAIRYLQKFTKHCSNIIRVPFCFGRYEASKARKLLNSPTNQPTNYLLPFFKEIQTGKIAIIQYLIREVPK